MASRAPPEALNELLRWLPIHLQLRFRSDRGKARACRSNTPSLDELPPWRLKRLDHGSDVAVLENRATAPPRFAYADIHHGPGQVVRPNYLVREQRPKRRVDRSYQAVAEIRFLPRLHRVDVRGPKEVNVRESRRE